MFFQPPRADVQREAMDRMLNIVRHNAEQDTQRYEYIENTIQFDSNHVDLSFYKLKSDVDEEISQEEDAKPLLNQLSQHASQTTHLNLQHNYLCGDCIFLCDKYDKDILPKLVALRELDLSHNEFNSFDLNKLRDCAATLERLDLSYNNLRSFGDVSGASDLVFDKLQILSVAYNRRIDQVYPFTSMIPNIVEIDLSSNSLSIHSLQSLLVGNGSLSKLKILRLSKNALSGEGFPSADATEFTTLPSLEELYLEENEIVSISDQWIHNTGLSLNLKVLSLSFNKLTSLNPVIFNENIFTQLVKLYADHNSIQQLPQVVKHDNSTSHVSTIEELRLNDNKLTEIQASLFTQWPQLKAISLQKNQLSELPSEISNLKSIEDLYLFGNCLNKLPESIGELKQLVELDLYGNRLEALPSQIGQLVNLKRLNLDDNNLHTIPNEIVNLTQLIHFTLRGNNQLQLSPFVSMMRTDK